MKMEKYMKINMVPNPIPLTYANIKVLLSARACKTQHLLEPVDPVQSAWILPSSS